MRRIDVRHWFGRFCRWWIGLRDLAVGHDSLEAGVESTVVGWWVNWLAFNVCFPGSESEDDLSSAAARL